MFFLNYVLRFVKKVKKSLFPTSEKWIKYVFTFFRNKIIFEREEKKTISLKEDIF